MGAFHLVKISGISGSVVNGTRFVGSSHWKIPRKVENLKRWARFPGWNFRRECRVVYLSRSLYQVQVHGRAWRRTGVCDQMEQRFTNRKFHFWVPPEFPGFFPKWKAPLDCTLFCCKARRRRLQRAWSALAVSIKFLSALQQKLVCFYLSYDRESVKFNTHYFLIFKTNYWQMAWQL